MAEEVPVSESDPTKVVKVGFAGEPSIRPKIIQLLREFHDVFAWSPQDMTGASSETITHKLNLDPSYPPVKQKKRSFAPERQLAIHSEVQQLLQAGILFEVKYPTWLANPVVVKKPNGE